MKVLVGLSGGVDSSVAAALLLDQGHEVEGVTMKLWGGPSDTGCCSVSDVDDARRVAQQLGIAHHVFNFSDQFDTHVVDPYVESHRNGETPNPCIECNRHIKFDLLLDRADVLGFDYIATGHHARRIEAADGSVFLGRGHDAKKDQSYVLYPLVGDALRRTLLPLGDMNKDDVRAIAAERNLRTAAKPDSQDVCFIAKNNGRHTFLSERIELHSAAVVDAEGVKVGHTNAVELVTVGQRRGLNLHSGNNPRFVTNVDVPKRRVVVGEPSDLLAGSVRLRDVVWHSQPFEGQTVAQTRAHGEPNAATVTTDGDALVVHWDTPQRRVAVGQSVVLYDGDVVVCGGLVRG